MAGSPVNDRVGNLTVEDINAGVVDTVNKSSEIMKRVVSRPGTWNGRQKQYPIFTNTSTLGQSFKSVETFDTTIDMTTQNLIFYPTGYGQPVGTSIVEKAINSTPAGKVDLYRTSYEYAQNSMITALANMFYGFGTGNDFDGFGNAVDDGTNTSSYGGLSRTTFGANINAGGSTGIIAASSGILDLATMASADDASTIAGNASESSNVVMANQTIFTLYESLLSPQVQSHYNPSSSWTTGSTNVNGQADMAGGLSLKAGATSLEYRGKPLVRDQKSPSGKMWFWNENWWVFNSLSLANGGLDTVATAESVTNGAYDNYKVSAFQFRKPMAAFNALSEVGIFVMYGNLMCRNPNRNELVSGITTT